MGGWVGWGPWPDLCEQLGTRQASHQGSDAVGILFEDAVIPVIPPGMSAWPEVEAKSPRGWEGPGGGAGLGGGEGGGCQPGCGGSGSQGGASTSVRVRGVPRTAPWDTSQQPCGIGWVSVFYTHFTDATAEARTNVALCPGVCREDEGPKAEGSFLLPAQCCVESSRFASKDLKANGIGDVSQPTPSGTRSSVPGDTAGPPSGLAVGPAPPCTRRAPPPALPAQGSRRPAWPTSSRHPGCGQQ